MQQTIHVGDTVLWRGCFGSDSPKLAVIEYMELCKDIHMKEGEPVEEVTLQELPRAIVDLDNGHWAYGTQIQPLTNKN